MQIGAVGVEDDEPRSVRAGTGRGLVTGEDLGAVG